jgi:hypothetical protein
MSKIYYNAFIFWSLIIIIIIIIIFALYHFYATNIVLLIAPLLPMRSVIVNMFDNRTLNINRLIGNFRILLL